MERQPYVRYKITADVTEKGTAYSFKQAIMTYLSNHKLEGRVNEFNATSGGFEGILELFPGGSMDLNMTALIDHVQTSGRLPTNRKHKPKNVIISPIPIGSVESPQIYNPDNVNNFEETLNRHYTEKRNLEKELENKTKDAEIAREESTIAKMLYVDLEERVNSLTISAHSGLSSVIVNNPTVESTKEVLDKNTTVYREAQTKVITGLFRSVADEIDNRRLYGSEEIIKNAKTIIEDRDNYLKSSGVDSLNHLPQAAKEIAEKIWSAAEEIVKKHDEEIEKIHPLKLPIYIAEQGTNMRFSVPLLQSGRGEVTRALGDALNLFRKKISENNMRNSIEQTDYMFNIGLQAQNGKNDTVRDSLYQGLNEIIGSAKITPVFVYTEFVPGMSESKTIIEEVQKQTEENSIFEIAGNKIAQRIWDLGFENIDDFATKNGLGKWTLTRLIEGKFTRGPNARTIGPFSKALNWTEEEYRNLFE